MNKSNKIIVVVGACGLLGKSFSESLSRDGSTVVIADVDINKASSLSKIIKNSIAHQVDITKSDSINKLIDFANSNFGRIDAVINTAYPRNKNYGRKFSEVEYDDFCENINLNIGGYFLVSKCFIKFFEKQKSGKIINISSVYGVIAPKFEIYDNTNMTMPVEYAVIKSSLIHLTKYLAKILKGKNIQVNCISPGGILDGQDELFLDSYNKNCINKGMLNPEDIYGAIKFLISNDSCFVNGQNIIIDDGFTL